ncbi:hypothetical protein RUMHYD_01501 [Blautia hydrogenotrophica DSM 10507]|uniref:Uncharacterized protein n=1 Tax=Blautia hydrogenotrophica (strain DSM 10507 / JCM 14656 / S5a33) TaxID=476272 RepID=C0CKY1_BLAHS|nr:hypothetical protein RUMHYD_01501 [Blautia hydrogenotrophica DSM 10507]
MRSIDEYMWCRNTGRKKLDIGQEAISSLYFLEVPPTGGTRVFTKNPASSFQTHPLHSIMRKNLSR